LVVKLHRRAEAEIREAAQWYSRQGEGLDLRFVQSIRAALEALERHPDRYAKLETVSADLPVRRVLVRDFPYVIIYEVFDADVFVYAVTHASRRPNYWRRRLRKE